MAQSLFCMVGAQEQQNGRIPAKGFTLNAPEVDCAIIDKVCHHVQQGKVADFVNNEYDEVKGKGYENVIDNSRLLVVRHEWGASPKH